jgi:hypothetical protein
MTKQNELAWIDRAITELGPHSYLGPWLSENRHDLISDITADLPVSLMMPSAAIRQAAEIVASAKTQAAEIVKAAEQRRADILKDADMAREASREQTRMALRGLINQVR